MRVPRSQRGGEIIEPLVRDQWFVRTKPLADPALKVPPLLFFNAFPLLILQTGHLGQQLQPNIFVSWNTLKCLFKFGWPEQCYHHSFTCLLHLLTILNFMPSQWMPDRKLWWWQFQTLVREVALPVRRSCLKILPLEHEVCKFGIDQTFRPEFVWTCCRPWRMGASKLFQTDLSKSTIAGWQRFETGVFPGSCGGVTEFLSGTASRIKLILRSRKE